METHLQKRLKQRLTELGINPYQAAKKANLGDSFVRDILRGKAVNPSATNLAKLAAALDTTVDWLNVGSANKKQDVEPAEFKVSGLPVLGSIQAGNWLDRSVLDEDLEPELIPVSRDVRFPRARQYGLSVIGDSMNLDFPDGSYVTCVDFAESGLPVRSGLTVHVERRNGPLVEVTLKLIEMIDGKLVLSPRSTNPKHKPLPLEGDDGTDIVICGVVTGNYRKTAI